jgi:hypothetical protein
VLTHWRAHLAVGQPCVRRHSVEHGLTLAAPPDGLPAALGGVWYLVVVWRSTVGPSGWLEASEHSPTVAWW